MKIWTIILLMGFAVITGAQENYKFKKVSKEMLEQTAHPLEADADAAFLYNGYSGDFKYYANEGTFFYIYSVSQRIKVYKESGKSWGDFLIPLYKSDNDEEVLLELDAFTFNLEAEKKVDLKLSKSDIFEEDVNEFYKTVKFAMPNVQEGSILEVRYMVKSPFTFRITEYYLQKSIPVDYAEYRIEIPEYFGYNPLIKGLVPLQSESNTGIDKIAINSVKKSSSVGFRERTSDVLEYNINKSKYYAADIPSLESEDYVHNINNYRSSIAHELLYTQYPNAGMKQFSNTWDKVAVVLDGESNFGKELSTFSKEAKDIFANIGGETNEEKAKLIYEYINEYYAWDGKNRLFGSGARQFLKDKKGNSADINLFLVGALRSAGFNANPVVCKTRGEGYLNVAFPVIADLNYVFALLETENGPVYLDATTKGMPFGFIPSRADNLFGVVVTDKTGNKIDIANPNENEKLNYIKLDLDESSLKGVKNIKYSKMSDFYARREIAAYNNEEEYIAALNKAKTETVISSCKFQNEDKADKDFVCTLDIDYSNYLKNIDGKIIIPLLLDQGYAENPFRAEKRNFNIFFDSKIDYKSSIMVSIPEGFQVEYIPESKAFTLPGRAATFTININQITGGYAINMALQRNVTALTAASYLDLKSFYDEIVKISNENIVISKS